MAILTAYQITKEIEANNIIIEPFDVRNLNANSYDLTLYPELQKYKFEYLNPKEPVTFETYKYTIPFSGFMVKKGEAFLCRTAEYTESRIHVPTIHGKSSIGRMFLFAGTNAGYGDVGYKGTWTLPLVAQYDVMLYPFMKICQIQWETLEGIIRKSYTGKYQNSREIQPSKSYEDIES